MELLISITILGVILTIIMGALRIGVRAWETGGRDVESRQRLQIVMALIKQQLGSAIPESIKKQETDPYVFKGDGHLLEFVSRVSIVPGNAHGKVYVTYRIETDGDEGRGFSLKAAEQSLVRMGPDDEPFQVDDADFYDLISGAHKIMFEYLGPSENGDRQWLEAWDPTALDGWPAAVRITLQMEEKKPAAVLVARFYTEPEGS
jgi:hypothetical protein